MAAELYLKGRAAVPLAELLIFLNVAKAAGGGLDARAVLCGLAFWWLVQAIYVYDSLFRTREDAVNLPGAAEGVGRAWPVLAAAAPAAAWLLWLGYWPILAVALLLTPLYSDPAASGRRLKTVPVVKSLVTVLNFWLIGVLAPVLLYHEFSAALLGATLRSSAPLLAMVFLLTVLLDVRDEKGDREGGVITLPVLLGPGRTAVASGALLAAGAAGLALSGQPWPAAFSAGLAAFAFFAAVPRPRSYYEWMLAAVNAALALRLALA